MAKKSTVPKRLEWNEFFDLYDSLTVIIKRTARTSVCAEAIDDGADEIGTSDVSHLLIGSFGYCTNKAELIKAIDDHSRNQTGKGLMPPCFYPEYDQKMEDGFVKMFS